MEPWQRVLLVPLPTMEPHQRIGTVTGVPAPWQRRESVANGEPWKRVNGVVTPTELWQARTVS